MRELLICLVLFAFAVAGFYLLDPYSDTIEPEIAEPVAEPVFEPNIARRDVTPQSALPAPELPSAKVERLPAIEPPPPPPKPSEPEVYRQAIAIAAGTLQSGETMIKLADIDPIPLDKTCTYADGSTWPCGMLARTELRLLLRGRPIECDPEDGDDQDDLTTRCKVAGVDISAWLVRTGWALPMANLFSAELDEAKAEKRGQWRTQAP